MTDEMARKAAWLLREVKRSSEVVKAELSELQDRERLRIVVAQRVVDIAKAMGWRGDVLNPTLSWSREAYGDKDRNDDLEHLNALAYIEKWVGLPVEDVLDKAFR